MYINIGEMQGISATMGLLILRGGGAPRLVGNWQVVTVVQHKGPPLKRNSTKEFTLKRYHARVTYLCALTVHGLCFAHVQY